MSRKLLRLIKVSLLHQPEIIEHPQSACGWAGALVPGKSWSARQTEGGEMNRILSIFGFFRHGHAEGVSMRRNPFILFRPFAPGLTDPQELELNNIHRSAIIARWIRQPEPSRNGLRLNWGVCSEGGRES